MTRLRFAGRLSGWASLTSKAGDVLLRLSGSPGTVEEAGARKTPEPETEPEPEPEPQSAPAVAKPKLSKKEAALLAKQAEKEARANAKAEAMAAKAKALTGAAHTSMHPAKSYVQIWWSRP